MAIFKQSNSAFTKYLIWYGDCESEATNYDLTSNSAIKMVVQHNQSGEGVRVFNSALLSFLNDFTELKTGHVYDITLKKGDSEFEIDGAVHTYLELSSQRKVTSNCSVEPTPTPIPSGCCGGKDYSIEITAGSDENESINQVSVKGQPSATLCWDALTGFSSPTTYLVALGDIPVTTSGYQLTLTADTNDSLFRIKTEDKCYEGLLKDSAPEITVFNEVQLNEPTPTPVNETPTPLDETPTPVQPTPTPTQTPTPRVTPTPNIADDCCVGMEYSLKLVNGTSDGKINEVNITSGNADGTMCWKTLTGVFVIPKEYTISLQSSVDEPSFSDGGISVAITGNFTDNKFRFTKSDTGICYEGVLGELAPTPNVFLPVSTDDVTPTPNLLECCDDSKTQVPLGGSTKGVALQDAIHSSAELCFESLNDTPGGSTSTFYCKLENGDYVCRVAISLADGLDAIKDNIFRLNMGDNCYEADFTGFKDQDFGPVMKLISSSEQTPTPTPTPDVGVDFTKLTQEFENSSQSVRDQISFTGQIVKVDLEGGFYGIELPSVSGGGKYLPVNIQTELSENETKEIQVTAGFTRTDLVGIHMWGTYAYITTYEIKNVGINPPDEETPTPTPDVSTNPVSCCADDAIKVAKGESLKGVALQDATGSSAELCFVSLNDTPGGSTSTFYCKLENGDYVCRVAISLADGLDAIKDNIFRLNMGDNCYEADFTGFKDQDFGPVMKLI